MINGVFVLNELSMQFFIKYAFVILILGLPVFSLAKSERAEKWKALICTGESPAVAASFANALNKDLTLLFVERPEKCDEPPPKKDADKYFTGAFRVINSGEVVFELQKKGEGKKSRVIPWLENADAPMQQTMDEGKTQVFGILLENLALEFIRLDMRAYLSLLQNEEPPEAAALESTETTDDYKLEQAVDIDGGVKWATPGLLAPRVGLNYCYYFEKIGFFGGVGFDFASTWEFEQRRFEYSGIDGRVGMKRIFFHNKNGLISVELAALLQYSTIKRTDIEEAKYHNWFDGGIGAYFYGNYRLISDVGVFFRGGSQFFPTAHIVKVTDGPEEKLQLFSTVATLGINFGF